MKKTFRLHFVKTECYYAVVEADSLQEEGIWVIISSVKDGLN